MTKTYLAHGTTAVIILLQTEATCFADCQLQFRTHRVNSFVRRQHQLVETRGRLSNNQAMHASSQCPTCVASVARWRSPRTQTRTCGRRSSPHCTRIMQNFCTPSAPCSSENPPCTNVMPICQSHNQGASKTKVREASIATENSIAPPAVQMSLLQNARAWPGSLRPSLGPQSRNL